MNKHRESPITTSTIALTLVFTAGLGVAVPASSQQTSPAAQTPAQMSAPMSATSVAQASDSAAVAASGAPPGRSTTATASDVVQNGYAENLRPTVRRKMKGPAVPYEPIKKQDTQGQIPEVDMFVGESRVFQTPNIGRIAVGNGQIMTAAALDNKEVIVFANGVGTSSLFIWNADGRYQRLKINIVAGDTSRIAREIAAFLATIPHAKASVVGDKVIVEGDSLSDVDLAKIDQLEKRYPQLVNFTNRVGWEQMVMMDVKVVEFPRSELREIGLKWGSVGGTTVAAIWSPIRRGSDGPYTVNIPAPGTGLPITNPNAAQGVLLPSALNILSGLNLGLNAQLNLLEQQGKASVLAEPQLSARNGAKASFLAGGEFPYSVSNVNGVTINFKSYGIKLDVTPKVDRTGVIRATIQAEVSSLDNSVSSPAGPALLTRKTDTEFNVRSGETIVLSGLLQRNSSTDIDKVPLLGDLPVLGALFRSKRFQNKETELVVFVTPTVVDSQSPGLVDRVQQATQRLTEQMGPQPYLTDPLQPGRAATDVGTKPTVPGRPAVTGASASPGTAATATTPVAIAPSNAGTPTAGPTSLRLAANPPVFLQVQKEQAILRAAPSSRSEVLLQLSRGAVVQLEQTNSGAPAIGSWRKVSVGQVEGWIAADALTRLTTEAAIVPSPQSNFAHAARQGQVVGTAAIGGAIIPAAAASSTEGADLATLPRYQVLLDGLAMRVSPDVNAMSVMQLNRGTVVEALPESRQGYWSAVQVAGRRGWVPVQWLLPVVADSAAR